MAADFTVVPQRTTGKGFVTERSQLNLEPGMFKDIENCVVLKDGTVARRRGFIEEPSQFAPDRAPLGATRPDDAAISTHIWRRDEDRVYVVVQVEDMLHIYTDWDNLAVGRSLIASVAVPGVTPPLNNNTGRLDSTPFRDKLVFTGPAAPPFYLSLDTGTGIFSTTSAPILIRDFEGHDDGVDYRTRPLALTNAHKYNLVNNGWEDAQITAYFGVYADYPSKSERPHVGVNANTGVFTPAVVRGYNWGYNEFEGGHFAFDPFDPANTKPATWISADFQGVTPVTQDGEAAFTQNPRCCTSYAGRLWFGGGGGRTTSRVFFTQVLYENFQNFGYCLQKYDPTSKDVSDLVADDGGYIDIPNAGKLLRIYEFKDAVLCFSAEGVWAIHGGGNAFTASNHQVEKISDQGLVGAKSLVEADGELYYWSDFGIVKIGAEGVESITDSTIRTFITERVGFFSRAMVTGAYDSTEKKITWLYNGQRAGSQTSVLDRELIYDINLKAFTKGSAGSADIESGGFNDSFDRREGSTTDRLTSFIVGAFHRNHPEGVWANTDVIDQRVPDNLTYVTIIDPAHVTETEWTLGFSRKAEENFVDFPDWHNIPYRSFVETWPETVTQGYDDQAGTYVVSYFQRTEDKVATVGPVTFEHPSGCLLSGRWEWNDHDDSSKWSAPQQAYRFREDLPAGLLVGDDPPGTTGQTIFSKLKIRGQGKVLALRYEGEAGKDFQLMGWSYVAKTEKPHRRRSRR